jgi:uncharacterized protein YceK
MKRSIIVFVMSLFIVCCGSVRTRDSIPFTVREASYYTWFVNETERGTQVVISLRDVKNGVVFDSLVFRTIKIPVVTEKSGDSLLVKAVISGTESVVESRALPGSGLNRLIYTWKGKRLSYEIDEFTREDSQYLKRE